MKMKALLSTSSGYKEFMSENQELVPNSLKDNFDQQVNKIIHCKQPQINILTSEVHKKYLKNKTGEDSDEEGGSSAEYEVFDTEMMDDMPLDTEEVEQIESSQGRGMNFNLPAMGKLFFRNVPLTLIGSIGNKPNLPGLSIGGGQSAGLTLDLSKARDLQENMAKKMVDKLNNNIKNGKTWEERAKINSEKLSRLDKEHQRILKLLDSELEMTSILAYDNKKMRDQNQELLDINEILVTKCRKSETRRRHLEKNIVSFRRSYMAFNFFLKEISQDAGIRRSILDDTDLQKKPKEAYSSLDFLKILASKYDPNTDYTETILSELQILRDQGHPALKSNQINSLKDLNDIPKKEAISSLQNLNIQRAKEIANSTHKGTKENRRFKQVEDGQTLETANTRTEANPTLNYSSRGQDFEEIDEKFNEKKYDEEHNPGISSVNQ